MNSLTILQEGVGELQLIEEIPDKLSNHLLNNATAVGLVGQGFQALFQKLEGKGFSIWISRYQMKAATILKATGHDPVLELRISLRNRIKGSWEKFMMPELPEYYYQFSFAPHVVTCASFDKGLEYETFDIHFELSFLEELGMDYKIFQQFIDCVLKDQPAELAPAPRRCPALMTEAVQSILHNTYSASGQSRLLQTAVTNILLAVVEDVDREASVMPYITPEQREALHEAKRLIEESVPIYPGNEMLCRKTCLNLFVLSIGFKRLFGINPYKYYNSLRMEKGKELLRKGDTINSISIDLEFGEARSFGKAFKEMFGITPREYRKGFRK